MKLNLMGLAAVVGMGMFAGQADAHTLWASSTGDFVWPVGGRITTTRYYRSGAFHGGNDIAGSYNTPVIASRSGYASRINYGSYSYGRLVRVSHSGGYQTYYAHNNSYGHYGSVRRGTIIAYRGSSGNSTGAHVHFEIRRYSSRLYIPGYVGQYVTRGYRVPYNYSGI